MLSVAKLRGVFMDLIVDGVAVLERPVTMDGFQEMFRHIYEGADEAYSDEGLLLRLGVEVGATMELMRKDRRTEIRDKLPRIFSWYVSVANRLKINLQEILWFKYPGICTYCLKESDCVCGIEHPVQISEEAKSDLLRRLRRERNGREPKLFADHQALQKKLYGWQNERILPIQVAAHIAEEVGEVGEAFLTIDFEKVRDEMADVFSWISALATRLEFDLGQIIWERYPYECSTCKKDICVCEPRKSRAAS